MTPNQHMILADSHATNLGFYSFIFAWSVLLVSFFAPLSDDARRDVTHAVVASTAGSVFLSRSNKIKQ